MFSPSQAFPTASHSPPMQGALVGGQTPRPEGELIGLRRRHGSAVRPQSALTPIIPPRGQPRSRNGMALKLGLVALLAGVAAVGTAVIVLKQPEASRAAGAWMQRSASARSAVVAEAPLPPLSLAGFGEPLPGLEVVSPFGLRQLPWEAHPRLHAGVDIAAPLGTGVLAVAAGTVVRMGHDAGYGTFVELEHEAGMRSLYAHLGGISKTLKVGAVVAAGSPVGEVGMTGSTTGAHLHLELRSPSGAALDPSCFLGRNFENADQWPMEAAANISPNVRYAVVSAWPQSKWEVLIASEEGSLREGGPMGSVRSAGLDRVSYTQPEAIPIGPGQMVDEQTLAATEAAATQTDTSVQPSVQIVEGVPFLNTSQPLEPPKPKTRAAFPSAFGG